MSQPGEEKERGGGTRPATDAPGIPDAPQTPAREPADPPDTDGVQGDEGGGEYPGRPAPDRRRARG